MSETINKKDNQKSLSKGLNDLFDRSVQYGLSQDGAGVGVNSVYGKDVSENNKRQDGTVQEVVSGVCSVGSGNDGLERGMVADMSGRLSGSVADELVQDWTVDVASRVLGVSYKTILRRIKRGSLKAYKINGQFGQEWRIKPNLNDNDEVMATVDDLGTIDIDEALLQDTTDSLRTLPDQTLVIELKNMMQQLESKLETRENQLQNAQYRLGYLESQLENHRDQIKLLTDTKSNKSWLANCFSWMFKK